MHYFQVNNWEKYCRSVIEEAGLGGQCSSFLVLSSVIALACSSLLVTLNVKSSYSNSYWSETLLTIL